MIRYLYTLSQSKQHFYVWCAENKEDIADAIKAMKEGTF